MPTEPRNPRLRDVHQAFMKLATELWEEGFRIPEIISGLECAKLNCWELRALGDQDDQEGQKSMSGNGQSSS